MKDLSLDPFVRAEEMQDCSLYWMPVESFPVGHLQRNWLLEFHQRLAKYLLAEFELREEVFLHFKSIYPDLVSSFGDRSLEFVPMLGAAITPGMALPKPIDMESLKKQVAEASKNGSMLDVQQWMPDLLYWFLSKKPMEQRQAFLGQGGMVTLFLAADPNTKAPVIELPRLVRTSPGFAGSGAEQMNAEIQRAYSLRDSFLAKSKEVFGVPLQNDPSYKGLFFVLPFFTAKTLTTVTSQDREAWFDVFDGYMVESSQDKGVLLLLKAPDFDEQLETLLQGMREDGHVYHA